MKKKRAGEVAITSEGTGIIGLKEAVRCACGRMAMILVNRDGKTRCIACDLAYKESKKTNVAI